MFSLFTRRIDDDMGRTHELEHSAIKCMRGILYCYMRQADKVSFIPPSLSFQHAVWDAYFSASITMEPKIKIWSRSHSGNPFAGGTESTQSIKQSKLYL